MNLNNTGVLWSEAGPCSLRIGLSSLVPLICLLAMLSVESGVEETCLVSSVEEVSKSYPLTK